ncbi:PrsW family glutamic-type intramembrane protease, partial [Actinomyces sp. ZJ308]|uniref:PrsW family glutamic-type intramembrane protease n=1 Tax=Actinomyces sp. ZJ308 TaxID=2708342 RepID=UPI001FBB6C5E
MVLTWVSLVVVGAALVLSPLARAVLGAWIGCLWVVVVCFWLARSRTVSWSMVSGVFGASMPWAGVVGWLSFQVAAAAGVPVGRTASQVVIAAVVEEPAKLAPVCLLALLAPGRVRRLLVQDWLVLGVACGAGFMAVEETIRRLTQIVGSTPAMQLNKALCPQDPQGLIDCLHLRTFGPWPLSDVFPGPVAYAGHAIVTGLVAVSIGLARHLWWRAGSHHPAIGVALRTAALGLPAGTLWVAMVDHMATNATTTGISWLSKEPVIKAWGATNGQAPWPVVGTTSTLTGTGHGRGAMLLAALVIAIILDARVTRLGGYYSRALQGQGTGPNTGPVAGPHTGPGVGRVADRDGGGWWGSWRARALAGLPSGVLGRLGADLIETTAGAGARTHR